MTAPSPCSVAMKHASDTSQRKGENVSDASHPADTIEDLEDLVAHEVDECRHLLRKTIRADADVEGIRLRLKETRARLRYLERHVEKQEVSDVS